MFLEVDESYVELILETCECCGHEVCTRQTGEWKTKKRGLAEEELGHLRMGSFLTKQEDFKEWFKLIEAKDFL